ncbi:hypothetical protein C7974DRAFT_112235 [Boeremia exigua]|uniref:uncharacterized protein n=1 Tax=Boeremia exigua TaxID=749465 RepID=UPI001E8CF60B|nr:uncharacterized protein C7974DRAFT_112235 [Boeremia exigua]KAH6642876.1 hypothetical protein C7974DRAFT_112235 [Boeremia exigua]
MIRVTTRVYPRLTLQSLSHYHYPSCTLHLPKSASRSHSVRSWFLVLVSAFVFLCFTCTAFRLEDTILALIRPPLVPLDFTLVLVAVVFFALSSYPWSQIAMVDRPTQVVGPTCCSSLLLLAEAKHAPMARRLSSCRLLFIALFPALFLLVPDWSCISCCRLVQIVAPGLPCLSVGSIGLSLMIVFIAATNQNWAESLLPQTTSSCNHPL